VKQEVTFAGPGGVVLRTCAELAAPDPAATGWESRISVSVGVGEIAAEGLGCNAGEDEVEVAIVVFVAFFAGKLILLSRHVW